MIPDLFVEKFPFLFFAILRGLYRRFTPQDSLSHMLVV
jgi:hypothetical protein